MVFALEGKRHLDCLQIEKSYVVVVACRNQEEHSLFAVLLPRSGGLEWIWTCGTLVVLEWFLGWTTWCDTVLLRVLLMFIEDLIDFIVILDKLLLAYVFLDQILVFIFLR